MWVAYSVRYAVTRWRAADATPDVRSLDVAAEAVTNDDGSFSATQFHDVTGYLPREYILTYVENQDGKVPQTEIVDVQPWSGSTVTRLLDELEAEGKLRRMKKGRANLVCLPEDCPQN
jgi:hypothetical protein